MTAPGVTETLICGTGTVNATEAVFVVSATDVAVRTTFKVTPGGPGAVYVVGAPLAVAAGETDPHVAPLQVMLQVTPLPDASLLTVAVNCAVASGWTVAGACDSETLMAGGGGGGGTLAAPPPQPQLLAAIAATNSIPKWALRILSVIVRLILEQNEFPLPQRFVSRSACH